MSKTTFKPIKNWVALDTTIKEEKTTGEGIIYTDNQLGNNDFHVWSTVHSVGGDVKEDIRPGDKVYWKLGSNEGQYYKDGDFVLDLVTEDNILAVDRETD